MASKDTVGTAFLKIISILFFILTALFIFVIKDWGFAIVFGWMAIVMMPSNLKSLRIYRSQNLFINGASVVLTGIILLAFWIGYKASSISGSDSTPVLSATTEQTFKPTDRDAKVMAAVFCEPRMEKSLKAPSTANFGWSKNVIFDGRTATLTSYVDAENSYGAKIRTHFQCVIEYQGGKPNDESSWVVKRLDVLN